VYLAYPNNPTGNLFAASDVEAVLRATRGLVVVDEAYYAFADGSFLPRVAEFTNLLVLRTVSKVGMAGIRLGYAVAAPEWIAELNKVRQPYNVNALTQVAAEVLLADTDWIAEQAAAIRSARETRGGAQAAVGHDGVSDADQFRARPRDRRQRNVRGPEGPPHPGQEPSRLASAARQLSANHGRDDRGKRLAARRYERA
jgi:histidinol-phosphate/aromatic aminotransferase/cobyric acid decarboxylase-like protein